MLNLIQLQGRLATEVTVYENENGNKATWVLAVPYDQNKVDWIPCVAWRETAEHVKKWFRKGDSIVLYGRLASYKDSSGHDKLNVVVKSTYFTGTRKVQEEPLPEEYVFNDADLPF